MPEKIQPPADKSGLVDGAKFTNGPSVGSANIQTTAPRSVATVANELEAATNDLVSAESDVVTVREQVKRLTAELQGLLGKRTRTKKATP